MWVSSHFAVVSEVLLHFAIMWLEKFSLTERHLQAAMRKMVRKSIVALLWGFDDWRLDIKETGEEANSKERTSEWALY